MFVQLLHQFKTTVVWLHFLGRYKNKFMNKEKLPADNEQQKNTKQDNTDKEARSSAFKEPVNKDRKQTSNPEEEAELEQERKEAMTERD
jgi:hypothetical protein